MSLYPRPRVDYGAHVPPADLADRIEDLSLEVVGGIIRTERDRVLVAVERRAMFPHPAVVVAVVRDLGDSSGLRFLGNDRIRLRGYELRALADLLDDAADQLEGPSTDDDEGDGDSR